MNERVLEIVVYIVDTMSSEADESVINREIEGISERLMKQGYSEKEIDSAFLWLSENLDDLEKNNMFDFDKILSQFPESNWSAIAESEQHPFSKKNPEPLRELDIVGDEEIEYILDNSLRMGKHGVTISEIKAKINNLILNPDDFSNGSFFVFNQSYLGH